MTVFATTYIGEPDMRTRSAGDAKQSAPGVKLSSRDELLATAQGPR
jgi:hypothetical protein